MSDQMSQIRMSQVEEEQKGHKKESPALSNGSSVPTVTNLTIIELAMRLSACPPGRVCVAIDS